MNKMVMNKSMLWGILMLASCTISAQDFKSSIKEIKKRYAETDRLDLMMEISVFENIKSPKPYYAKDVQIQKEDDKFRYQVDNSDMFMNERCMIMVDKAMKHMTYSKRDINAEKKFQQAINFDIDSVLSTYDDIQVIDTVGGIDHFLINEEKGPIAKVHFRIVRKENTLHEMRYEYHEGLYVIIKFLVFNFQPTFHPLTFSEQHFVQEVNGKLIPGKYYKNYRITF